MPGPEPSALPMFMYFFFVSTFFWLRNMIKSLGMLHSSHVQATLLGAWSLGTQVLARISKSFQMAPDFNSNQAL
jgi:hypothetical protein